MSAPEVDLGSADAFERLAWRARREKRPAEGLGLLEQGLRAYPSSVPLRAAYARFLAEADRVREAEAMLAAMRDERGADVEGARGCVYALSGAHERAIESLTRLTRGWPERPDGWIQLAILRRERGESEHARAVLVDAVRFHPSFTYFHVYRGMCEEDCHRLADAEASFRTCLALAGPGVKPHGAALHLLGVVLGLRGKDPEAIAILEAAVPQAPHRDEILHSLAVALRGTEPREAVSLLEESLMLDSSAPKTRAELGFALWRCGDLKRAESLFREASRPPDELVLPGIYLALLLQEEGRLHEARSCQRALVERLPKSPLVLWPAVFFHRRDGDAEAATRFRARALASEQDSPRDLFELMRLLRDLGRRDELAELAERLRLRGSEYPYFEWVRSVSAET